MFGSFFGENVTSITGPIICVIRPRFVLRAVIIKIYSNSKHQTKNCLGHKKWSSTF